MDVCMYDMTLIWRHEEKGTCRVNPRLSSYEIAFEHYKMWMSNWLNKKICDS